MCCREPRRALCACKPGFSHQHFRSSNQQDASQTFSFFIFLFLFFYLIFISNQDCESIRLANRHNHTSHPAALMWDRALSSLFILPLPHSQLFCRGGGIDESAANIVRIRAEEESERPRGRGGGGLELQTVKHTVV